MTCITGDMMGNGYPVLFLEFLDAITHGNHISAHLMPKDQGYFVAPVPLHDIASAYSACDELHQLLTRADFVDRHLLEAHVFIAVIHGHFHDVFMTPTLSPL